MEIESSNIAKLPRVETVKNKAILCFSAMASIVFAISRMIIGLDWIGLDWIGRSFLATGRD